MIGIIAIKTQFSKSLQLELRELAKKRMKMFKNIRSLREELEGCGPEDLFRKYNLLWDYEEA